MGLGHFLLLIGAAFAAGLQNAVAGGGSFLTFPALLASGLDARAANMTSTVALFPGQLATGFTTRRLVAGAAGLGVGGLIGISLAGGAVGAWLLLETPPSFFERLVPFLVLFATCVFAWASLRGAVPASHEADAPRPVRTAVIQFLIAVYGGYFGGGIGLLMLAALSLAGQTVRAASATKNLLAGAMNATAVLVFVASTDVHWRAALAVCLGAIAGGVAGGWLVMRVNETRLRWGVVAIGAVLTAALFARAYS